jgi:hypothetical protein
MGNTNTRSQATPDPVEALDRVIDNIAERITAAQAQRQNTELMLRELYARFNTEQNVEHRASQLATLRLLLARHHRHNANIELLAKQAVALLIRRAELQELRELHERHRQQSVAATAGGR